MFRTCTMLNQMYKCNLLLKFSEISVLAEQIITSNSEKKIFKFVFLTRISKPTQLKEQRFFRFVTWKHNPHFEKIIRKIYKKISFGDNNSFFY